MSVMLKVSFAQSETGSPETLFVTPGTTIRGLLSDMGVSPNKHEVLVNGEVAEDLDATLSGDDSVTLRAIKYSSGC